MNNYFKLSDSDKILLIKQTAERVNLNAEAVEKDLWVAVVLQTLFSLPYADKLVFKGGTSLSKIWNCITRFSEDVDIAIDRSIVTPPSPTSCAVLFESLPLHQKDYGQAECSRASSVFGVVSGEWREYSWFLSLAGNK